MILAKTNNHHYRVLKYGKKKRISKKTYLKYYDPKSMLIKKKKIINKINDYSVFKNGNKKIIYKIIYEKTFSKSMPIKGEKKKIINKKTYPKSILIKDTTHKIFRKNKVSFDLQKS